jgi:DNA-binding NarL/FixJ family response regulator
MNNNEMKPGTIITTLIVDDHQLVRNGLKTMLHAYRKELEFDIHEMGSGEKALQWLNHSAAELVIIDYKMEGMSGTQTIERILRFRPETKILALSNYNEYPIIAAMMEAGALGYVLKSVQPEELLIAIKTVLAGKKYFCSEAALVMITGAEDKNISGNIARYKITGRELEVLVLIVQGFTNAQIAEKLFLNRRTIDTHRQNLLKKMKVKNTAALVRLALELQLLG